MSTFTGSEFSFKSETISMFFVIGFAVNSTRDSGQKTSIFTKQLFIGSKAGENPKQLCWFQTGLSYQEDSGSSLDKHPGPIYPDIDMILILILVFETVLKSVLISSSPSC